MLEATDGTYGTARCVPRERGQIALSLTGKENKSKTAEGGRH